MTDPTAPGGPDRTGDTDAAKVADGADPLDELASAYIDGEASPAEVARVDADPELQARVARLRTVAAAVAQPVRPCHPEVRDAAIAAALAAAPAPTARTEPIEVTDLARVRDRRRHGRTRTWALSVAAAVLVALAAIPLLAGLGDDGDNSATDVAGEQLTEQADRAEAAADDGGGEAGVAAETETETGTVTDNAADDLAPDVVELGTLADEDELLRAIRREHTASTAPPVPLSASGGVCASPLAPADEILRAYRAEVTGASVTAYVYRPGGGGAERVLLLDAACAPLLDTAL